MGRTVPSYRTESEWEKRKWKPFRDRLDKSDRKIFDEMMSITWLYNVAGVGACKPVLLHPILMSIVFEHYKQLRSMENRQGIAWIIENNFNSWLVNCRGHIEISW
jgi:hypothetical protein